MKTANCYQTAVARVLAFWVLTLSMTAATAKDLSCDHGDRLLLTNGKIVTLDERLPIASWLEISGTTIVASGNGPLRETGCKRVIDLQGRTVIPGLIDSHVHFLRQGLYPGYDARDAESATDIASLLATLNRRRENSPTDSMITVIGGLTPRQLDEKRLPNRRELDRVSSGQVIYLQLGFAGPAQTNTAGLAFFRPQGIEVDDSGHIAAGAATNAAFDALKRGQTEEDRQRATQDLMSYANSLGITTVFDEGGTAFPGASYFDPLRGGQTIVALWRKAKMTVRVRLQFSSPQSGTEAIEQRLANSWHGFGDNMLRIAGMGEHVSTFPQDGTISPAYGQAVELIAAAGWPHEQHSTSFSENEQHIAAIESADRKHSIADLRWSLSHVFELGAEGDPMKHVPRLNKLGMGVRVQNHGYTAATDTYPLGRTLATRQSGPLYRTLMDAGLPMGAGTDGALAFPMNPWFSLYYMVSGRDVTGELVNEGETLTRMEALRLYTLNNAMLSFEESRLGTLEAGKLADLVVLSDDYLTVPEEKLKELRAVLTIVGGKAVYSDSSLTSLFKEVPRH